MQSDATTRQVSVCGGALCNEGAGFSENTWATTPMMARPGWAVPARTTPSKKASEGRGAPSQHHLVCCAGFTRSSVSAGRVSLMIGNPSAILFRLDCPRGRDPAMASIPVRD